jgi:hypothetical protein
VVCVKAEPSTTRAAGLADLLDLARGRPGPGRRGRWIAYAVAIILGSGAYGATIGLWRAPLQGLYTAIKFPLLIGLVTLLNGLLNGMLAQLMGARAGFRHSLEAVAASFAIFSLMVGSLAPVTLFVLVNLPPLGAGDALLTHNACLVMHVAIIALAGVTANARLYRQLAGWGGGPGAAGRILAAWLAANLFLGAQLSWNLRPFVGSPGLAVAFFRPDAFRGSFYESVWISGRRLLTGERSRPDDDRPRTP